MTFVHVVTKVVTSSVVVFVCVFVLSTGVCVGISLDEPAVSVVDVEPHVDVCLVFVPSVEFFVFLVLLVSSPVEVVELHEVAGGAVFLCLAGFFVVVSVDVVELPAESGLSVFLGFSDLVSVGVVEFDEEPGEAVFSGVSIFL